jgi:fused signal recognition particle receptor
MGIGGFFQRLKDGLKRTAGALGGGLRSLFGRRVDQNTLDRLEEILLSADVGIATTEAILAKVKTAFENKEVTGDLVEFVKNELKCRLRQAPKETALNLDAKPTILMIAGVNGSGKTTSIAKLAQNLLGRRKKILLGAGDTFRAAAIEQLDRWAKRAGTDIVKGQPGSDPAAVAHDACQAAAGRDVDVAIIDTAGRLHTQTHLMRELEKIHRVIGKVIPGAPHECLLVLDGTVGQNAIQQAVQFTKSVQCTGVIVTKLDGSAKGGVIIPIREKLGLPVKFIGVGEQMDDLQVFDADSFVDALFDTE